jgi:hypothetical protein
MTDSIRCYGNYFLFRIELLSLWISERNVLLPAWVNSAKIYSVPDKV